MECMANVTLWPLYPPVKTRCPLYGGWVGPQGRSGRMRKISPPPGFDSLTVQPVAIRYTDWAIATHVKESDTEEMCCHLSVSVDTKRNVTRRHRIETLFFKILQRNFLKIKQNILYPTHFFFSWNFPLFYVVSLLKNGRYWLTVWPAQQYSSCTLHRAVSPQHSRA